MDVQEIIEKLEYFEGTFPRRALQEAVAKKEEITPALLEILERAADDVEAVPDRYMAHIYAMYLLAQFREPRAYPVIVRFFSHPGEAVHDATGDVVTEDLKSILASVSCGDDSLIKQLVENPDVNEYVRMATLDALVCLVAEGEKSREEVLEYFRILFRTGLFHRDRAEEPDLFWAGLVSAANDLYPDEVYEEIKQAFQAGLIDESFIDLKWVDRTLARGKETVLAELQHHRFGLVRDVIKAIEWWACFRPVQPQPAQAMPAMQQAAQRRKIGRNEPCPCGSGKKYKKCCGARSAA
jgi:uncharacterized protein DUF1186/SEC-C motif-containing protein